MRALLLLLPLLLTLTACQTPEQPKIVASYKPASTDKTYSGPAPSTTATFAGGDGLLIEHAVIVQAPNEKIGVRAEYVWLAQHYPGWRRTNQALARRADKSYDVLDIEDPNAQKLKIYFDISGFFGKL